MNVNELAFYTATFGNSGTFSKITDAGWNSEQHFLEAMVTRQNANWSYYDDGRKVMKIRKSNGDAGLDLELIVLNSWVATLDYTQMEASSDKSANKKVKIASICEDDYDTDYDDDDVAGTEDYGLEDYNDDYGWWR